MNENEKATNFNVYFTVSYKKTHADQHILVDRDFLLIDLVHCKIEESLSV